MHHPNDDRAGPPRVYTQRAADIPSSATPASTTVAIVGGGLTGLSAALHLAEAGVAATVLEARHAGWGASGRAFGQVVPYLKHDAAEILRHYGAERGERVIQAVADGPSLVAGLIDRLGIACDLRRSGLIFAAHSSAGVRTLAARAAFWQQRGVALELTDPGATAAAIGSEVYQTALIEHRGVHLNPFGYTAGLAGAAHVAGARIVHDARVTTLEPRGTQWELMGSFGTIRADAVILATNAYTDRAWPGLMESIVPLRGHGMVSAPLSENVRQSILPGGQALTDTRRLFSGVRILADGRLHASLDGPAFGAEAGPDIPKLNARLARLFPQLGDIRWAESWSGFIAMTPDHFPRVHQLAPGVFAGLGYSGRGIAGATMIGAELAARVRGVSDKDLVFPLSPLRPVAGRRLAPIGIGALMAWWRLRDAIDDRRGVSPG